jgi:hypothetical protein
MQLWCHRREGVEVFCPLSVRPDRCERDRMNSAGRSTRTTGSARANRTATDLAPVVAELQAAGITSLNGIAAALNERHVPTPGGSGHWYAAQVSRLLKRLAGHCPGTASRPAIARRRAAQSALLGGASLDVEPSCPDAHRASIGRPAFEVGLRLPLGEPILLAQPTMPHAAVAVVYR